MRRPRALVHLQLFALLGRASARGVKALVMRLHHSLGGARFRERETAGFDLLSRRAHLGRARLAGRLGL